MYQTSKQYQIKITSLTPICIGDGQKLSPFSDYKLKRDKLIYLNHEKIKGALENNPNLIDDYVEGIILGKDNTGNNFDVEIFFLNRAKLALNASRKELLIPRLIQKATKIFIQL